MKVSGGLPPTPRCQSYMNFISHAFAQTGSPNGAGVDLSLLLSLLLIGFLILIAMFAAARMDRLDRKRTGEGMPANPWDRANIGPANRAKQQVIVKTYQGSQSEITERFQADSVEMATSGYFPTSQSWAPGRWGVGASIVAVLLIFLLGFRYSNLSLLLIIPILAYMLIMRPDGTLTVTYEWRTAAVEEKTCPKCAERIKAAALVCHFCGYEFT